MRSPPVRQFYRNSESAGCSEPLGYDKNQNDDADRKGVMRAPKELAHRLTTPGAPLSPKLLDYVNNHRLRTLIIGTIGSIMVTLGSYAVGWLADSSNFWRYDIVRAIRFEAAWVITGIILLALGAMAMAFVGRDRNIVRHAGLAILFMLLCSPMIQPWYLLWAIPMLAATGLRSHFQLMWYFITTLFFMAYGVSDQLNVSPYLRDFNQDMGRLIATVICLGYIIYLVALDPATRRLVYVSLHPTQIRRTTIRLWWQLFPGATRRRARRREVKKAEREASGVNS